MGIYCHIEGKFFRYSPTMEEYPQLKEVLAKIVRERREALHMSKRQLSKAAYIERSYITGLENGNWNPSLNVVLHLCEALKIEPEEFMRQVRHELEEKNGRKWPFLE